MKLAVRCALLLLGGGCRGAFIVEQAEAGLEILALAIRNESTRVSIEFVEVNPLLLQIEDPQMCPYLSP